MSTVGAWSELVHIDSFFIPDPIIYKGAWGQLKHVGLFDPLTVATRILKTEDGWVALETTLI